MAKSSEGLKSAAEVAKQIIALSTGVITVTVAFFDKLQGNTPSPWVHGLILASWLLFIATIYWAVQTLMGVTTALDVVDQVDNGEKHPPPAKMPSAWDPDVKNPAQWMVVCFFFALIFTAAAGFFRPSAPPPANTTSGAPPSAASPAQSAASSAG